MKQFFSFILALSLSASASAATLSCKQLVAAYKADQMNSEDFECSDAACKARQLEQLRQTVKFHTEEDVSDRSWEELAEYDAFFGKVHVGQVVLEYANIDLGDNSFLLYFEAGTSNYSGISTSDGTIDVDGEFCDDFAFEPIINLGRREALCRVIVPLVQTKLPQAKLDLHSCTTLDPVDSETGNKTNVYVRSFDRTQMELSVSRNMHDVGAGYFSCSAELNRLTDEVANVRCDIQ
jgi:hypothetical protein